MLLVFDSEELWNIGCRLTSRGIKRWLSHGEATASTPLTTISARDIFSLSKELSRTYYIRIAQLFSSISIRPLYSLVYRATEHRYGERLRKEGCVIINGEGTIHHHRITGLILIAIGELAASYGAKVILLNATVQALSPYLCKRLARLHAIVVREPNSSEFLARYLPTEKLVTSLDFAWYELLSSYPHAQGAHQPAPNAPPLFSPGTSTQPPWPALQPPTLLIVEENDQTRHPAYLHTYRCPAHSPHDIQELMKLLNNYSHLISGRHHLVILALYIGMRVHTLPANTWKIEGTLRGVSAVQDQHGWRLPEGWSKKAIASFAVLYEAMITQSSAHRN